MNDGLLFLPVAYPFASSPKAVQGLSFTANGPGLVREQEDMGLTLCMALPQGACGQRTFPMRAQTPSLTNPGTRGPKLSPGLEGRSQGAGHRASAPPVACVASTSTYPQKQALGL